MVQLLIDLATGRSRNYIGIFILAMMFPHAGDSAAQGQSRLFVNGIYANPSSTSVTIMNRNDTGSTFPAPATGTILHLLSQQDQNGRVTFDNYYNGGTQGSVIGLRRGRGTSAAPSAPMVGDVLGAFTGDGYGTNGFSTAATVSMVFRRDSGTYSNTSKPSRIVFGTTADGATTQTDRLTISQGGRFTFHGMPAGIMQTDANGVLTPAALTGAQVNTALGYTPANGAASVAYSDTAAMLSAYRAAINGKFSQPAGTTAQYLRGDGSLATYSPDQTVTLTAGAGITVTGTYPNFTISAYQASIYTPSRTVNSNYTVSATKQATLTYSVTCSVTNPLLVGSSTATVYLEYSINAGSTWVAASQVGNSSAVGITVTIAITNGQTGVLSGTVPANALVRIRTATTGTASVSIVQQQEVY